MNSSTGGRGYFTTVGWFTIIDFTLVCFVFTLLSAEEGEVPEIQLRSTHKFSPWIQKSHMTSRALPLFLRLTSAIAHKERNGSEGLPHLGHQLLVGDVTSLSPSNGSNITSSTVS